MNITDDKSISLIGIAGAGKSTLSPLLASALGWEHMDTDRYIEGYFGHTLQQILDKCGREEFLRMEEHTVSHLSVRRCVISTGGSVVYSEKVMKRLQALGPVVLLDVSRDVFLERVGTADNRGFIRGEGMTLEDIYDERKPLYDSYADITVSTDKQTPEECVRDILSRLGQ